MFFKVTCFGSILSHHQTFYKKVNTENLKLHKIVLHNFSGPHINVVLSLLKFNLPLCYLTKRKEKEGRDAVEEKPRIMIGHSEWNLDN